MSKRDAIEFWSGYAITVVTVVLVVGYCWMEMTK